MSSDWEQVELGKVVELKRGYDLPKSARADGPFPVVSSSGVSGNHTEFKAQAPGVVIGRYGTLGEVHWITNAYWPLNTSLYVRDFKGNDARFVSYLLKTIDYFEYSDKAAVPGVNRNHLHQAIVTLPPLPEQRAIAGILGALDDKIDLNRRMNETLEAMARAIFKSWFVDFDPVRAKMEGRQPFGMDQATAALFPDRLVESEIGLIPEGWEVTTLGQHITLDKGLSYKGKHLADTGTPLVNLKCINRNGGLRPDGMKHYNGEYKPRHVVQPGDIVIANTDLTQDRQIVGCPAFVPETGVDDAIFTHHLYAARISNDSGLRPDFLFHLLLTETARERARGFATGTTVLGLPRDAILEFCVALPNAEIMSRFTNEASLLRIKRDKNSKESRTLAELRDLLLPKLLSGEIRVADAEQEVEAAL